MADEKLAYSLEELAKRSPVGRSSLYKAIKEKRLMARKCGRRTLVLAADYVAFLEGLPAVQENATRPGAPD